MFGMKRIVVTEYQRALEYHEDNLVRILSPGVYRYLDPRGRIRVDLYDLYQYQFTHSHQDLLLRTKPELMQAHFDVYDVSDQQIGLVTVQGKFKHVLEPGSRHLFWKDSLDIKVELVSIDADFKLPAKLASSIYNTNDKVVSAVVYDKVYFREIADSHTGLLIVDGQMQSTLTSGLHAYWKFNRNIDIETYDLRMQTIEVQGQEILTKDKVSVRANLSAHYRIKDPVVVHNELSNVLETVYRELQFGLRQAIGTRTLDALLANKSEMDEVILQHVQSKLIAFGVDVPSVGVKDIILPGDMKEILNQVVEAEKVAQANVIKRREETAATRSLLNTAKLMDDNPILLRLKEMEVLEKITEKVDNLTVFGGLEGVLNDTIKLNLNAK